jgi:hypothetical protein
MIKRSCQVLIAGIALLLPLQASANMESCTQAHAAGQREENAGHLKEALASFQECASDSECPLPIRNECTSLYSKVESRLPTLVFSVVDDRGNDVTDVRVSSNGASIANGLDGRPVAVNPGLHEFRFELPGGQELTKSVVVRQGEKDRIVNLTLPRNEFGTAEPARARGETPVPADERSDKRLRVPLASWISYGVGAAALASWGAFGLVGRGKEQDLVDCSPRCAATRHEDYDAMKRDYLIADISLGVAGAAVVAGTVLLFTMGRRSEARGEVAATAPKPALSLSPVALGRVGGGLVFGGRY